MRAQVRRRVEATASSATPSCTLPRQPTTHPLDLPDELLEGCRSASLQIAGPRLTALGVTSTLRGEGRSSVALAFARIHEEDYQRRVVLLDLDLEQPHGLARRLGASGSPGVAELARGEASLANVLQPVSPRIELISAGAWEGPSERTMSTILRSGILREIRERADILVADLPPLLGSSFGTAPVADFPELLLVVRSGVTPLGRIRQATAHLPVEPKVILNGTRSSLPLWVRELAGV
jgi:Mrp family chromosome partitioning ATPase